MGVQTEADDAIQDARDAVRQAIRAVSKIVIDQCWGAETFSPGQLQITLNELLAIRDRLGE